MKQFTITLRNACVCLWIHLLLSICYGGNGTGASLRNVNDDVLGDILIHVANRSNAQLISRRWRDILINVANRSNDQLISNLEQKIADLSDGSNETLLNRTAVQIRTIMQTHPDDLIFRKRFGAALPSILTRLNSKNLSLSSTQTLLSALNINVSRIITYLQQRNFAHGPVILQGIDRASLFECAELIVGLYLDCVLSVARASDIILPILYHAAYYKTLMRIDSYQAVYANETIIWNYTAIQSIPKQIRTKFSGSGTHVVPLFYDREYRDFQLIHVRDCSRVRAIHNVFWTEFVLSLMDIDEGANGIQFRLVYSRGLWRPYRVWEHRHFILMIVSVAYHHYSNNDIETFDRLICSLSTVFFCHESIIRIAQIPGVDMQFRSLVFAKLSSLRWDWQRMSMLDMLIFERGCSDVGLICIKFFVICGVIMFVLLGLYAFGCTMVFSFVTTVIIAWFVSAILNVFSENACALNFENATQIFVDLFPSCRVLRLMFISIVFSVLWIFLCLYPLFVVPW
eukprot:725496_1